MIILIGDVHGDFASLINSLSQLSVTNSFFIQVGDFGIGFKNKERVKMELQSISDDLKKKNNVMYVIRGNHDDPNYFREKVSYPNLYLMPDYSILTLEGMTILLAGGAISVDRRRRVVDDSYWIDEGFSFEEQLFNERIREHSQIDMVVTHNAPAEFQPTEINPLIFEFAKKDTRLINDLNRERRSHTRLMKLLIDSNLKPNFWYYGHYHFSHSGEFDGIKYRLLNCLEFAEHRAQKS